MSRDKGFDNVRVIKTIDPIVQALLLVWFIYSLDTAGDSYKIIFFALLLEQMLSIIYNFFTHFRRKLKTERILFLIAMGLWGAMYVYVKAFVKEKYFQDHDLSLIARTGVYDFSLLVAGSVLTAWYAIICFREIKGTIKRRFKED
jgi:hypothetical protein